jgi:hypothetical protein
VGIYPFTVPMCTQWWWNYLFCLSAANIEFEELVASGNIDSLSVIYDNVIDLECSMERSSSDFVDGACRFICAVLSTQDAQRVGVFLSGVKETNSEGQPYYVEGVRGLWWDSHAKYPATALTKSPNGLEQKTSAIWHHLMHMTAQTFIPIWIQLDQHLHHKILLHSIKLFIQPPQRISYSYSEIPGERLETLIMKILRMPSQLALKYWEWTWSRPFCIILLVHA